MRSLLGDVEAAGVLPFTDLNITSSVKYVKMHAGGRADTHLRPASSVDLKKKTMFPANGNQAFISNKYFDIIST